MSRSRSRRSDRASVCGAAQSATRGASPGYASAYRAVSPIPTPQDPCRATPRASSRARLAARWYGVVSSASRSTVSRSSASPTPAEARWAASAASASGSTSMNRDRWVRTPGVKVPEPNWANVWCRPSVVTTLCAAWAPPLNRTTAWTGRPPLNPAPPGEQTQSATEPFPESPYPRSTMMTWFTAPRRPALARRFRITLTAGRSRSGRPGHPALRPPRAPPGRPRSRPAPWTPRARRPSRRRRDRPGRRPR